MTNCIAAIPAEIALLIAQQSSFYHAICIAYLSHKNSVKEAVRKRILQDRYGPFDGLILSFNLLWKIHTNTLGAGYLTYDGKIVDLGSTNIGEGRPVLFDIYCRTLKRPEKVETLDQYKSAVFAKDIFHERITILFQRTQGRVGIRKVSISNWLYIGKNIHFTYINTPLIGGCCEIRFQEGVAVFLQEMFLDCTLKTAIIFAEIFYKDPRDTVYIKCNQNMINAFYAIGVLPYEIQRENDLKDAVSHHRPFAYDDFHFPRFIKEIALSKNAVAKPFYEERRKKYLTQEYITNWDPEIFRCYLYKRVKSPLIIGSGKSSNERDKVA